MDTLQLDSTRLAVFRHDKRYDYDRELTDGSQNLLEWLSALLRDWMESAFNVLVDNDAVYYSLIVGGVLLVLFIGWLVWRKSPAFFMRRETAESTDYDVQADSIYGTDFDAAVGEAMSRHDYRQCVRLLYLQTLKLLSDAGRIDWQPSKTPSQYVREYGTEPFAELSGHFIRVRYGNFEATEELCRKMKSLQDACCAAAATAVTTDNGNAEKGGAK